MISYLDWNKLWKSPSLARLTKMLQAIDESSTFTPARADFTSGKPTREADFKSVATNLMDIMISNDSVLDRSDACDRLFATASDGTSTDESFAISRKIYKLFRLKREDENESFVIRESCFAYCKFLEGKLEENEALSIRSEINDFMGMFVLCDNVLNHAYSLPWDNLAYPEWVQPILKNDKIEVFPVDYFKSIPKPSHIVCFRIADMLFQMGHMDHANEWIDKAIQLEPVLVARYWYLRGWCNYCEERYIPARSDFEEWMRLQRISLKHE
jgi:tetratricopeptide (TPR) repeat protein